MSETQNYKNPHPVLTGAGFLAIIFGTVGAEIAIDEYLDRSKSAQPELINKGTTHPAATAER